MTTVHPAAELFPLMEGADFERLVQSMRESGYDPDVIADLVADLLAQLAEATEQIRRLEDQLTEKSFELELFLRANRALIHYLETLALQRIQRVKRASAAAAAARGRASP